MLPLSRKIWTETPEDANPLCSKHLKNTKEILKNTKEKLSHHNIEIFRRKTSNEFFLTLFAAFLRSLRFYWHQYWHIYECWMTYAICVIYAINVKNDKFDIPDIGSMSFLDRSIWVSIEAEGPWECSSRPYNFINISFTSKTSLQSKTDAIAYLRQYWKPW